MIISVGKYFIKAFSTNSVRVKSSNTAWARACFAKVGLIKRVILCFVLVVIILILHLHVVLVYKQMLLINIFHNKSRYSPALSVLLPRVLRLFQLALSLPKCSRNGYNFGQLTGPPSWIIQSIRRRRLIGFYATIDVNRRSPIVY